MYANNVIPGTMKRSLISHLQPFPSGDGSGKYAVNASHEVTKLLRDSITLEDNTKITLVNPTAAEGAYVKTEYAYIRQYAKDLHEKHADDIDLYLHIGQADGWDHVTVERRAYKQGFSSTWWGPSGEKGYYMIKDNAGKTIEHEPNPWGDNVPIGLGTALFVDRIVVGANKTQQAAAKPHPNPKPLEVKPHHEAGNYGCGFIYYESLANRYVKGRSANVLFCHVPGETDKESVSRARDAIEAIVVAAVEVIMGGR